MKKNEKIYIKEYFDDIYLERDGIIIDKFCPACKKFVDKNEQFCECGVFLGKKNKTYGWVALIISILLGLFVSIYLSINYKLDVFSLISPENLQISSLTPINIQLISALNDTPYKKYVQNIYTKPDDESSIVILIRPSLWHMLNKNDKKIILQLIQAKGEFIFKQKSHDLNKKISVIYANAN